MKKKKKPQTYRDGAGAFKKLELHDFSKNAVNRLQILLIFTRAARIGGELITMKLAQGQVWKLGDHEFIWIVTWARLEIEYKKLTSLVSKEGTLHTVTKKEFCRLVKRAGLVEVRNGKP